MMKNGKVRTAEHRKTPCGRGRAIGVAIVLSALFSSELFAQAITPAHVLQVVEALNARLEAMNAVNFSVPAVATGGRAIAPRKPRHVIQKARDVLRNVETLRFINGLPTSSLPTIPVREVRPADVKRIVDRLLDETDALRERYGLVGAEPILPLKSGVKPTAVYRALMESQRQLLALGVPKPVPNDVYQAALTLIQEMEALAQVRRIALKDPGLGKSKGKIPGQVYNETYRLLEIVKDLGTRDAKLRAKGGVTLPNKKNSGITPADVLDLQNHVLAELSSIKVASGVTTPTVFAPEQSGKTPSDVFDAVARAAAYAAQLAP